MDLDRLREFARIAECGSVSAAARRLGLSVATLSARLRGLEKSLGTNLFDREGRALILTDADGTAAEVDPFQTGGRRKRRHGAAILPQRGFRHGTGPG